MAECAFFCLFCSSAYAKYEATPAQNKILKKKSTWLTEPKTDSAIKRDPSFYVKSSFPGL